MFNKIKNFVKSAKEKIQFTATSMMIAAMTSPVYANTINTNLDPKTTINEIMNFLLGLAQATGGIMAVWGAWAFASAYRAQDGEAQSRSIKQLVAAVILIGLPAVLKAFKIFV